MTRWNWKYAIQGFIKFAISALIMMVIYQYQVQTPIKYIALAIVCIYIMLHIYSVAKWWRIWIRYKHHNRYTNVIIHFCMYFIVSLIVITNIDAVSIVNSSNNIPSDEHDGYTAKIISIQAVNEAYSMPIYSERYEHGPTYISGNIIKNNSIDVLEIRVDYIMPYIDMPYTGRKKLGDINIFSPIIITATGEQLKPIAEKDIIDPKLPYYTHVSLDPTTAASIIKDGKQVRPDTSISWYIPFEAFDHRGAKFCETVYVTRGLTTYHEIITISLDDV